MPESSRSDLPPALEEGLRAHRARCEAFLRHAGGLSERQWETPRAAGKWSPAHETAHLALAYGGFAAALRGGPPLAPRVAPERALDLHRTVLPGILEGAGFPTGATAPLEMTPPERPGDRDVLLAELRMAAQAFEESLIGVWTASPEARVFHPYFGPMRLTELLGLLTAHTGHHARNLPPLPGASAR
jgi:uncharacterized damage-inducible protein DinB